MSDATGRFWLCPVCQKHVPGRADKCQCGFDRTTVKVAMREVSSPRVSTRYEAQLENPSRGGASSLAIVLGVALSAGIGVWFYNAAQENSRANAELRERTAQKQADHERAQQQAAQQQATQPSVVFVPQAQREGVSAERVADQRAGASGAIAATGREQMPAPAAPLQAPGYVTRDQPPQQEPQDPTKSEPYWRQRLFQSRERIRNAYDQCILQFSQGGFGDFGTTQYAREQGGLISALSSQFELEEDARKAGAPSGWVRFDYAHYPQLTLKDSNTNSLTHVHPCSVPDLLKDLHF